MSKPWMSEGDIALSFNRAEDKKAQIKILAELNATSRDVIIEILERRPDVDTSILTKSRRKYNTVARGAKRKQPTENDFKTFEKLHNEHNSDKAIAKLTGFSQYAVRTWRLSKGLPPAGGGSQGYIYVEQDKPGGKKVHWRTLTPERHQQYLELYNKGLTDAAIAAEMKLSNGSVIQRWRTKNGLPANGKGGRRKSSPEEDIVT